jgi:hypothetical protein
MNLLPGESLVLIIHRTKTDPSKYFLAVRKCDSSFSQGSHDFQMHGPQQSVLELGSEPEYSVALEKAIKSIRELER